MILVWRGWGILAPALIFLELLLTAMVPSTLAAGLQKGLQFLIVLAATFGIWYLGNYLNSRPGRVLVDPETGEKVELRSTHTFFWIPMQYWAFIGAILCVLMIAGGSSSAPKP